MTTGFGETRKMPSFCSTPYWVFCVLALAEVQRGSGLSAGDILFKAGAWVYGKTADGY